MPEGKGFAGRGTTATVRIRRSKRKPIAPERL
jgi:hypothetical protein